MGGAFSAISGDLPSITFNPATLSLVQVWRGYRFSYYLNPVSPAVILTENRLLGGGDEEPGKNFLEAVTATLKSFTVSFRNLDIGLLLGEESLDLSDSDKGEAFFPSGPFRKNYSHTLAVTLRLDERIALGMSGSLLVKGDQKSPLGSSYGVLLVPNDRYSIGVFFINLPNDWSNFRNQLERLDDETVNVGLSLHPDGKTTVAVDLRNLAGDTTLATRELHLGFERVVITHLALRAGAFRKKPGGGYVFSGGVGLVDLNRFKKKKNWLKQPNYLVNYAFVREESNSENINWHFLTINFRI